MTEIPSNCTWVDGVSPADVPAPNRDGRHERSRRTRHAILSACRASMRSGIFRPSAAAMANEAGVSVRTVFDHFDTHEGMLTAALQDDETQRTVLALILRDSLPPATAADRARLFRAILVGRA